MHPLNLRKEKMIKMRNNGETLKVIGDHFKVSRERVRQIISGIGGSTQRLKKALQCPACGIRFIVWEGERDQRKNCDFCTAYLKDNQGREYVRALVRLRDDFTCQECGLKMTPKQAKEKNKRLFDIHHLGSLCGKKSRSYDRVKDMKNLITLCHRCHFNRPDHTGSKIKIVSTDT